jgi:hypothetical protein
MRRSIVGLAAASLGAALAASGQPGGGTAAYQQSDRDHDGVVDRQEFHDRQTDVFFFLDRDKDGALVQVEVVEIAPAQFGAADKSHDEKLSLEEFQEARAKDFRAADANRDGGLTAGEVQAHDAAGAPKPE